ncbi:MAG TPA: hypothetical protein VNF69_03645 [Burkholderiales bacterium]|nr:hypothetical protein [Burkholderiales bacterium]
MNASEAQGIVRSLARGVDPVTGDAFPAQSAYQRAQLPPNTGVAWTEEEEDRRLLAAFEAGRALGEVAAEHQRTQGAIRARLVKYGRLAA